MAKVFFSNNFPLPGVPPSETPSRPPARKTNIITAAASGFAGISAVKHAVDRAVVLVRSTQSSGVDAGETSEAGSTTAEEKASSVSINHKRGLNFDMLPNIPVWARWFLGSLVVLSLPFYKKFLRIEDEVEKTVETAVEVAEVAAKMTKSVVADVADGLPEGDLKKLAVQVEEIAQVAIVDSEKVKSFICKVDEVKEEIEQVVDPIAEDAGAMFLKGRNNS